MILPSVKLIISFFLVFTVGSRKSFRNLFTGTFLFIIVIQFPQCIPITISPLLKSIEPYIWTPPTSSFFFFFISEIYVIGSLKS
ncbi:hypothetical protein PPACK8108_LOCUS22657 [Phakopsora pachyrhizi]|uniref:Uncharacterized protein n=1 Tax=Phakopsora pachyrhizi TaxID=170000 RepID=A0AAV0BKR4_PHAPC|nr:hypothetical protein PPACK8108_LOCUS22657 [Phakopsora pachyrhizi]